MRLELSSPIDCADGRYGRLLDVVIDPTSKRVTHLVVESEHEPTARLVPVELAHGSDDPQGAVVVRATAEEMRRLPPVREVAYLRLGDFSVDDPDWDVGIEEVFALPYYTPYDLEPEPVDRLPRRLPPARRTRSSPRRWRFRPPPMSPQQTTHRGALVEQSGRKWRQSVANTRRAHAA